MKLFAYLATCVTATMALATSASALESWPRWYLGLSGSLPMVSDSDATFRNGGTAASGDISYDNGWAAGASLGYRPVGTGTFLDNTRYEIEYRHAENDLQSIGSTSVSGNLTSHFYMFNVYADIPVSTTVMPYIGGGIGMGDFVTDAESALIDDKGSALAYQGMVGIGFAPETMPRTVFNIGYRYVGSDDYDITNTLGTNIETDYEAHNIEAGARFLF